MEANFMKALVFQGPKQFEVKEVPIPQCGADEMLVRVRFAGVCGTDNRIYQGTKVIAAPRITGHEFSGTIERLGSHVKGYQLGQRVSVYPMLYCGHCYCCREGRTNICVNRTTIGYEIDGGFAQYVKIPKRAIECGNVVPIPDNVSDEIAAISEPIAASYHGMQQAGLRDGETFVIIGAGPIGLFHTQLSRSVNLARRIVIEPIPEKRKMALEMGADFVIDPAVQDAKAVIFEQTGGQGGHASGGLGHVYLGGLGHWPQGHPQRGQFRRKYHGGRSVFLLQHLYPLCGPCGYGLHPVWPGHHLYFSRMISVK